MVQLLAAQTSCLSRAPFCASTSFACAHAQPVRRATHDLGTGIPALHSLLVKASWSQTRSAFAHFSPAPCLCRRTRECESQRAYCRPNCAKAQADAKPAPTTAVANPPREVTRHCATCFQTKSQSEFLRSLPPADSREHSF